MFLVTSVLSSKHLQLCIWLNNRVKSDNRIGGVIVCVFASNAIDRGFEPQSGQTKDYKIGIWCFSAKHTALRGKSKDWSARNKNNVSEWSDMSIYLSSYGQFH